MRRIVVATLLGLLPGAAGAQCPAGVEWPGESWASRVDTVAAINRVAISDLESYAFNPTGADEDRVGIRSDGVVIIKDGRLIYEQYGRGFGPENRHLAWSVTKSVFDALTGAAELRGMTHLNDTICDHVSGIDGNACGIIIANLLEQGSGLEWNEGYEDDPYAVSSVLAMLYGEGHRDMARFVVEHRTVAAPGGEFVYTSGGTVLLAKVLAGAVGNRFADSYPWVFLFDPLGMKRVVLERDSAGTFIGGSLLYATPRDLARFGYLYLRDGCWQGERILPEGWVAASTRINETFLDDHPYWQGPTVPGRLWWLNAQVDGVNDELPWPGVPADAFAALGHWGQSVVVIPSLDLVIVRTGDDRDDAFDMNEFLSLAIAVAKGV